MSTTADQPLKRLPLHSSARADHATGPLVVVLHYEGEYVRVRSLLRKVTYSTPAARLRAA